MAARVNLLMRHLFLGLPSMTISRAFSSAGDEAVKTRLKRSLRLRHLLFDMSKKQQGDFIPKHSILQACDEYAQSDAVAKRDTLKGLATELGVDVGKKLAANLVSELTLKPAQ
jgi:hypothetical protein